MKIRIQSLAAITFTLATFALQPIAEAVVPPPEGGYPNGNTAEGQNALHSLTSGGYNTAIGFLSLFSDTQGSFNTAIGAGTLLANTGDNNTATGGAALLNNTTGDSNTANGYLALFNNTGRGNTAVGSRALVANQTGTGNVAVGERAGQNVVTADGVICIGASGDDVSYTTWLANVHGVTTQNSSDPLPVIVTPQGQLGTQPSSVRFKKQVRPMDKVSEAILSFKPVTFFYKSDTKDTPQFGLIAEDVAAVNPDLVVRDKKGEIYTVRYDAVNAMLLNEFLKEHRKVEELKSAMAQQRKDFEAAIVQQQKTTEVVVARLNEQEARIQKVSAQVETRKSGSQMLVENQ